MKYSFTNNAVTFGMNQYCNMQIQAFTDESLVVYTYWEKIEKKLVPGNWPWMTTSKLQLAINHYAFVIHKDLSKTQPVDQTTFQ